MSWWHTCTDTHCTVSVLPLRQVECCIFSRTYHRCRLILEKKGTAADSILAVMSVLQSLCKAEPSLLLPHFGDSSALLPYLQTAVPVRCVCCETQFVLCRYTLTKSVWSLTVSCAYEVGRYAREGKSTLPNPVHHPNGQRCDSALETPHGFQDI